MDLNDFSSRKDASKPLADRMRPKRLDEFVGQQNIIGEGKILRDAIKSGKIPSMIFWGPPGSGKTTLANVIAKTSSYNFISLSAVTSGVKDIKEVVERASIIKKQGKSTILFVDEIHRFNKSQQDALLPHVENGTVTLIGATTENPSFEVNSALLSRCRVFVLNQLESKGVELIIKRALTEEKGLGNKKIDISENTISFLSDMSNGDARTALNALEFAVNASSEESGAIKVDENKIKESLQKAHLLYDKGGEQHYNIISALHKSMRGSDPDAAVYWCMRMLEAGEDPTYVARRIIQFASEDIGMADSNALSVAVSAFKACEVLGMPECNINLCHAVIYMAKAPKSNKVYLARESVKEDIKNLPSEGVPLHLRNAPSSLMKDLNYGKDYKYTPEFSGEEATQDYLPEKLKGRKYWEE